jgi:periplasmic divalent cation tolerance protein
VKDIEHIVVFITATDTEEAQLISKVLLEQRKAACVNIVPKVSSIFWWKEKLESDTESLLVVKTKAVLLEDVIEVVCEVHSYENPEILALPVYGGSSDYLEWLDEALVPEAKG